MVVTHNGAAWLEDCLRGLRDQVYPNLDVVVVDAGSAHDVAQEFGDLLPHAEFVRAERNVGFGAAANAALEVSVSARDAEYFLFLHDDVEMEPETLSLMAATAMETDAGIVGAKGVEWDRPEVLVEVGMSADQFGYPYSGLDPGEIDQGQHDMQKEVLYVTSACMLVSRSFVERCGLWDAGYFAFGEDLDLCTRARLAGFRVMVQPGAKFRHAEALSNEHRNVRAIPSTRFLTRRNRLRTITKNVALYRMVPIMILYIGLSVAEVFMLIFFRRFEQIGEYPRALASYAASLPDVLRRRRAVQKLRAIPDRRLRRFMVSDSDRARVFLERRVRAWERGTVALGARTLSHLTPSAIKSSLLRWVRRPSTIAVAIIVLMMLVAMRKTLIGAQVAGGSLWPFPDVPTASFLGSYLAAWRDVGLGTESAAPPAFVVFWLAGVMGFGSPGFAQKLLLLFLIAAGLVGAYRFVSKRTFSMPARVVAIGIYGLGPVTHAMVSAGDLGGLALFAGVPYMLEIALRILGLNPEFKESPPRRRTSPRRRPGRRSSAQTTTSRGGISSADDNRLASGASFAGMAPLKQYAGRTRGSGPVPAAGAVGILREYRSAPLGQTLAAGAFVGATGTLSENRSAPLEQTLAAGAFVGATGTLSENRSAPLEQTLAAGASVSLGESMGGDGAQFGSAVISYGGETRDRRQGSVDEFSRDLLIRDAARLGLISAGVIALGPSSLVAILLVWSVLSIFLLVCGPFRSKDGPTDSERGVRGSGAQGRPTGSPDMREQSGAVQPDTGEARQPGWMQGSSAQTSAHMGLTERSSAAQWAAYGGSMQRESSGADAHNEVNRWDWEGQAEAGPSGPVPPGRQSSMLASGWTSEGAQTPGPPSPFGSPGASEPPDVPEAWRSAFASPQLGPLAGDAGSIGPSSVPTARRRAPAEQPWLRIGMLMLSAGLALMVLLPWSLEGLRPRGAILSPLFSGRDGVFSPLWHQRSFAGIFFMTGSRAMAAIVPFTLALAVLILTSPLRRQEGRLLITIWLTFAAVGGFAATGLIAAPAASPQMWLAVCWFIVAALGAHLVAGLKEELPRHHFGWRHQIAMPVVALAAAVGVAVGWVPPLADWQRAKTAFAAGVGEQSGSISSFLTSTAEEVGDFRVLWLGSRWVDPIRVGSRRMDKPEFILTGPRGLDMLEAIQPPPSRGERRLDETVASLVGRRVHLAGHLLAPAGIRFIIADPTDKASIDALRMQRDVALEQQQGSIAVFRNLQWLPRAVLAPASLSPVTAGRHDETRLMLTRWSGGRKIPPRSESSFTMRLPRTTHSQILLGDNFNRSWRARVGDDRLSHERSFGWANQFPLPPGAVGEVRVSFSGRWLRLLWLALQALILLVVSALALARRRETTGRLR